MRVFTLRGFTWLLAWKYMIICNISSLRAAMFFSGQKIYLACRAYVLTSALRRVAIFTPIFIIFVCIEFNSFKYCYVTLTIQDQSFVCTKLNGVIYIYMCVCLCLQECLLNLTTSGKHTEWKQNQNRKRIEVGGIIYILYIYIYIYIYIYTHTISKWIVCK